MAQLSAAVAFVLGVLQGVFEWLPISSEGNISLVLTVAFGLPASDAVDLSLFLHAGTAVAATAYYRDTITNVLSDLSIWRPRSAFDRPTADLSFLIVATLSSFCVGLVAYLALESFVSAFTGGTFVVFIGVLLLATGLFQRAGIGLSLGTRSVPNPFDAVLAGGLQGLAVLPGVSRSGVTTGALLLRGHEGPDAFRLSFLLSIPAALGAAALVVIDSGGLPSLRPAVGAVGLLVSAVVGYLTIGLLMKLVERVSFWAVCAGLGLLATVGGLLLLV
jgi:undecaprenyl-diphosphatase